MIDGVSRKEERVHIPLDFKEALADLLKVKPKGEAEDRSKPDPEDDDPEDKDR